MNHQEQTDIRRFETIVEQSQHWLFRFAYMRIGRREDSEDLVQEVLLSLYRAIIQGKKIKEIDRYLLHSISNACIDYHRRRPRPSLPIDEIAEPAVSEDEREMQEEYMRISRILSGLPEEQSETVRLKCYDDLTFRQIAELQGVPEATVKSRYRYAITSIQKKLNYGR